MFFLEAVPLQNVLFEKIFFWDRVAFDYFVSWGKHRFFQKIWATLTHLGGATATLFVASSLYVLFPRPISLIALHSLTAIILSHIFVALCKKIFRRPRPTVHTFDKTLPHPPPPLPDHSFPSGHTTAIWALVMPFVYYFQGFFYVLILISICVSLSRIVLGHHYPSDVLVGSFIGIGAAWGIHQWLL